MRLTLWVAPISNPTSWALADEDYIVVIVLDSTDFSVAMTRKPDSAAQPEPETGTSSSGPGPGPLATGIGSLSGSGSVSVTVSSARFDGDHSGPFAGVIPDGSHPENPAHVGLDNARDSDSDSEGAWPPTRGAAMLRSHPVLQRHAHVRETWKRRRRHGCSDSGSPRGSRSDPLANLSSTTDTSPASESPCTTTCGDSGCDSDTGSGLGSSQSAIPSASGAQVHGPSSTSTSSCSLPVPETPHRVSITGDATSYDGMKANLVQQVRRLRATGHDVVYLNTVCQELDGM